LQSDRERDAAFSVILSAAKDLPGDAAFSVILSAAKDLPRH